MSRTGCNWTPVCCELSVIGLLCVTNFDINANAFVSTFYFLRHTKATSQKNKKSLQANTLNRADLC